MAESTNKAQQQDEASTSKSFPKIIPIREPEEHTVITITTDSQTTDEESIQNEENIPETGEVMETDEVTEVYAPPPTTTASRTLNAQTPMSTSPIDCSTAHRLRTNGRDLTATPRRPSDNTAAEECKIHGNEKSRRIGFRAGRRDFKEKNNIRMSSRIE